RSPSSGRARVESAGDQDRRVTVALLRSPALAGLVFLVALAALGAPSRARAQAPEKLRRVGMLEPTPSSANAANLDALRRGFAELGYVEGKTFAIEYRSADGHDERFPALAAELVRSKVDVLLT